MAHKFRRWEESHQQNFDEVLERKAISMVRWDGTFLVYKKCGKTVITIYLINMWFELIFTIARNASSSPADTNLRGFC